MEVFAPYPREKSDFGIGSSIINTVALFCVLVSLWMILRAEQNTFVAAQLTICKKGVRSNHSTVQRLGVLSNKSEQGQPLVGI